MDKDIFKLEDGRQGTFSAINHQWISEINFFITIDEANRLIAERMRDD